MKLQTIVVLILSFFLINNLQSQIGQLKVNDTFVLKSFNIIDEQPISLDNTNHKVFVMNFWNIGCKGCEQERPYLNELYHKYKDKDVVFWSITMNTKEHLESFLTKHPIDWEVKGGIDFMGLKGDQTFLIKCMPTTILIDKNKNVRYSKCGPILEGQSGNDFIKLIDEALAN